MMQHRLYSEWYFDVARVEFQWFETRVAAEMAEQQAIAAERPLHNQMFNRRLPKKNTPIVPSMSHSSRVSANSDTMKRASESSRQGLRH